jgi:hypothetical protein
MYLYILFMTSKFYNSVSSNSTENVRKCLEQEEVDASHGSEGGREGSVLSSGVTDGLCWRLDCPRSNLKVTLHCPTH